MIAEPAPAQFRNITLPQIAEKIVSFFSHLFVSSL